MYYNNVVIYRKNELYRWRPILLKQTNIKQLIEKWNWRLEKNSILFNPHVCDVYEIWWADVVRLTCNVVSVNADIEELWDIIKCYLEPTVIVARSNWYDLYWYYTEPVDAQTNIAMRKKIQNILIEIYNSKREVKSEKHLFFLPGTKQWTNNRDDEDVKIIYEWSQYTFQTICSFFSQAWLYEELLEEQKKRALNDWLFDVVSAIDGHLDMETVLRVLYKTENVSIKNHAVFVWDRALDWIKYIEHKNKLVRLNNKTKDNIYTWSPFFVIQQWFSCGIKDAVCFCLENNLLQTSAIKDNELLQKIQEIISEWSNLNVSPRDIVFQTWGEYIYRENWQMYIHLGWYDVFLINAIVEPIARVEGTNWIILKITDNTKEQECFLNDADDTKTVVNFFISLWYVINTNHKYTGVFTAYLLSCRNSITKHEKFWICVFWQKSYYILTDERTNIWDAAIFIPDKSTGQFHLKNKYNIQIWINKVNTKILHNILNDLITLYKWHISVTLFFVVYLYLFLYYLRKNKLSVPICFVEWLMNSWKTTLKSFIMNKLFGLPYWLSQLSSLWWLETMLKHYIPISLNEYRQTTVRNERFFLAILRCLYDGNYVKVMKQYGEIREYNWQLIIDGQSRFSDSATVSRTIILSTIPQYKWDQDILTKYNEPVLPQLINAFKDENDFNEYLKIQAHEKEELHKKYSDSFFVDANRILYNYSLFSAFVKYLWCHDYVGFIYEALGKQIEISSYDDVYVTCLYLLEDVKRGKINAFVYKEGIMFDVLVSGITRWVMSHDFISLVNQINWLFWVTNIGMNYVYFKLDYILRFFSLKEKLIEIKDKIKTQNNMDETERKTLEAIKKL